MPIGLHSYPQSRASRDDCHPLLLLTFCLCFFCISDLLLIVDYFSKNQWLRWLKWTFWVFFLFVFSFEVVFIPFRRCNSLGLPNFGLRVLLLCMQCLLCWHCFTVLVFRKFSVPCTTDDHLYAAYYLGFLAPCTTTYDHLYCGYYPEWRLHWIIYVIIHLLNLNSYIWMVICICKFDPFLIAKW